MKYTYVLLLISFNLAAQIGEPVPSLDCDKYSKRTLPHQGLWYNVDLPGTGLTIEHQKNIVVGTFYNFDDEGNQAWYLLSGELQPSDDSNTMWSLETNLKTTKVVNALTVNTNQLLRKKKSIIVALIIILA